MTTNYYQKHKEKLWKEAHEKHQNISEVEKERRRKKARDRSQQNYLYHRERTQNLSEEQKQNQVEDMTKKLFSTQEITI